MDTSQHDESADTDSSRPARVARSGKTTPERSPENQQQRQSSDEEDERLAADVLLGAKRIAEHLAAILGVPIDENDIYYAHRMEKLPIGKYGGS